MKIKSNILIHSSILFFFLLFFALVYKPVVQGHYFFGDDYIRIWTTTIGEDTDQSYVSYAHKIPAEGRPLHLLYAHIIFNKYINSLKSYEAANTVRIIGIIGVGLLSYFLYLVFKANKFRTSHAVLLSILICTLPPIQIYLGWLIMLVGIYSILLSVLSFLVLFNAVFKEQSLKKTDVLVAILISMILFIASLCIYQPTATVYWALAIIPITMMNNEDFIKKRWLPFTIYFSTGFISMIIYFKIIKIFNLMLNIEFQGRGSLVRGVDQLYQRLLWFINNPFYDALNLWNIIYYTQEVKLFVSVVIITGILYSVSRTVWQVTIEKKGLSLLFNLLCKYLLIIVVILLSYIAHLATAGSGGYYNSEGLTYVTIHRTLPALEIGVLLLFYWGLKNTAEFIKTVLNLSADVQNKIVTIVLVILTVAASFLANHNIDRYIVKHNTNEYMYVKDTIQQYGISKLSKYSTIYVKPAGLPRLKNGGDIRSFYGEFFSRSSGKIMVQLALYELGVKSDISIVVIRNIDPETGYPIDEHDKRYKRLPEDENVLKIDMSKMNIKGTYDLVE